MELGGPGGPPIGSAIVRAVIENFVEDNVFALHGCYAAYVGSSVLSLLDSIWTPSSRVKRMGRTGRPETSADDYQHTFRNKSKERKPNLQCGGSPKFLHERQLDGFVDGASHVRAVMVK